MFLLQNQNLGEQALNKIAELALARQFAQSQTLSVKIQTNPTLLAQGTLASLTIYGTGLVTRDQLPMTCMDLRMGEITVDPLRALMGNIELAQPIQGTGVITLTAKDFTRALLKPELRHALRSLTDVEVDRVETHFHAPDHLAFTIHCWTPLGGQQVVELRAAIAPDGGHVALVNPHYSQGTEPTPALTQLLLTAAVEILNLQRFELNGMTLQATGAAIADQQLQIQTLAQMTEFPS